MRSSDATILLVEDDVIDVKALKRGLAKCRIANPVREARDGVEALEILRGENGQEKLSRPFLILLDLNMPRMNGAEFLAVLRKDEKLCDSVVFVLTTSAAEQDRSLAYDFNVAGYIMKKSAGEDFIRAIEMLEHYWKIVLLPDGPGAGAP